MINVCKPPQAAHTQLQRAAGIEFPAHGPRGSGLFRAERAAVTPAAQAPPCLSLGPHSQPPSKTECLAWLGEIRHSLLSCGLVKAARTWRPVPHKAGRMMPWAGSLSACVCKLDIASL